MIPSDVSNPGNLIGEPIQKWMDYLLDKGIAPNDIVTGLVLTAACPLMPYACLHSTKGKGMGSRAMRKRFREMVDAKAHDRARLQREKEEKWQRTACMAAKKAAAKVEKRLKQERRVRQVQS
jgi:hypothetical protein